MSLVSVPVIESTPVCASRPIDTLVHAEAVDAATAVAAVATASAVTRMRERRGKLSVGTRSQRRTRPTKGDKPPGDWRGPDPSAFGSPPAWPEAPAPTRARWRRQLVRIGRTTASAGGTRTRAERCRLLLPVLEPGDGGIGDAWRGDS